jgi:ribonuclease HI
MNTQLTPALRAPRLLKPGRKQGASVPPANAPQPPALSGRSRRTTPVSPPSATQATAKLAPARVPQARTGTFDIVIPRGPWAGQVLGTVASVRELRALWDKFPLGQTLQLRNTQSGYRFTACTSYALPAEEIDYLVGGLPTPDGDWYLPPNAKNATLEVPAMTTPTTPDVIVYADGACSGNPGPAAFAAVLVQGQPDAATCRDLAKALRSNPVAKVNGHAAKVIAESIGNYGSNNVAELSAVLAGLAYIVKAGSNVVVRTDSQNVIGWLSLGWKRKSPAIVDLAGKIDALIAEKGLTVAFEHVKGHAGDPLNDLADRKAQAAIRR